LRTIGFKKMKNGCVDLDRHTFPFLPSLNEKTRAEAPGFYP